jgi:hypothetical protein
MTGRRRLFEELFEKMFELRSCSVRAIPSLRGAKRPKQSILSFDREMDCFASLAMTGMERCSRLAQGMTTLSRSEHAVADREGVVRL